MIPDSDDNETSLFREAVRDVKPLTRKPPVATRRPAATPRARLARADRFAVLQEGLDPVAGDPQLARGDELVFQREGVQTSVLRKLRRGQYAVQAQLDLHGLTVAQATQELRAFVVEALERGYRCIRIVHGKGLRSGNRGPVLKNTVSSILRRVGPVLAYVSARQADGGTGAVYVLLAGRGAP